MLEEHVRGRLPDPRSNTASAVTRRPSPSLAARIKMLEADAEKRNPNARLSPSPSPHRSRSRGRAGSLSAVSEISGVSSTIEVPTSIPTTTCPPPQPPMDNLPPTPVEEDIPNLEDLRTIEHPMNDEIHDTSVVSPSDPENNSPYTMSWGAGLQRRASVISLSRVSFAAQLSRLTSLSLPLSEDLSNRIRQLETADEMCEALASAGRQIGRWIDTAKKVLKGLDAEDDVEWAAQGRESLTEVDNAVTKFSGLMNVYIELIDELQSRPDSDSVDSSTLVDIVSAMEATIDGWKSVQELLRGVKDQVETAMEWTELWTTILQDIQAELEACQTLVFELEERRHRTLVEENGTSVDIDTLETIMEEKPGGAPFPMPNGKSANEIEDGSLLGLFARMQPLRASLDFLPMRLSGFKMRADRIFPTACDELDSRNKQLERKWSRLNADAEGLKRELGEDRWVAIFRNAGKQATAMLDSIERSMNKLREAVIMWDETGGRNDKDLRKKIESYEAKKMHYGNAIQRTFSIIGKGISDRFTVNGEIIRLDTAMRHRWKTLEAQMSDVDQTLNDLQVHSQALRDSISSLTSLDLGSSANTPGSSPASSVAHNSPGRKRSPADHRPSSSMAGSRKSSISHIPRSPYAQRSMTPNISPRTALPTPASLYRAVSSPAGMGMSASASRLQQPAARNSLSTRPRWNGSTKTDDGSIGHNFKPLTLTTPSPYRKTTPPSTSSGRRSSMGGVNTRIPVPSPLSQSNTSPSFPKRGSMHPSSPSPAGRRPELRGQQSASGLRQTYAGRERGMSTERPSINVRPASAMATNRGPGSTGRRSSMLPRPPSGAGNRQSMPSQFGAVSNGKPRWRP